MIAWPYLLVACLIVACWAFIGGVLLAERFNRVPVLPPRLTDPPEPKADARDDWWRE